MIFHVRGMNDAPKRVDIKKEIRNHKPQIAVLVETKIRPSKADRARHSILADASFLANYQSFGSFWTPEWLIFTN